MKISEMIKNLQEFMDECGDMDCWYSIDDEGNAYHPISYSPSLMCVLKYNREIITLEDAGWNEYNPEDYDEICVVN